MKFLGSFQDQINASVCLRVMLKELYFGEIDEIASYSIFFNLWGKTHTHTELRNQSAIRPMCRSSSSNSM